MRTCCASSSASAYELRTGGRPRRLRGSEGMRIIVFIIVAAVQLVAAACVFLVLIMGMNGFSERDANPGLAFYIVLALASSAGLGVAGAMFARWLTARRGLGGLGAAAIAVVSSSTVGLIVLGVAFFGALMVASIMHGSR